MSTGDGEKTKLVKCRSPKLAFVLVKNRERWSVKTAGEARGVEG